MLWVCESVGGAGTVDVKAPIRSLSVWQPKHSFFSCMRRRFRCRCANNIDSGDGGGRGGRDGSGGSGVLSLLLYTLDFS